MKALLITAGVIMVVLCFAFAAFAEDGNNWSDSMGDILTGKANTYFVGGVGKKIEIESTVPLVPKEILFGVYTKIECSRPLQDNNRYYEGGGFVFALY